ncbi:hypothetical protein GCM10010344_12990 [Streptomyces bluensis]|nr:hypothetical protein GCM10010344_12990 [Streptomyces bluensis]
MPASERARQDAKARAEAERAADEKVIAAAPPGLAAPEKKELAQKLVASAEKSTLDWRTTYGSIEDIGDGCGYTAGIISFCTGTHDLRVLVERYTKSHPDNGLATYLPALREVDGTDSHEGLDPGFTEAWRAEANAAPTRPIPGLRPGPRSSSVGGAGFPAPPTLEDEAVQADKRGSGGRQPPGMGRVGAAGAKSATPTQRPVGDKGWASRVPYAVVRDVCRTVRPSAPDP